MKRNFNKRKRFNNHISESIYIGIAFGIFIIFCISMISSCNNKKEEVKPIVDKDKKYIDGDIVENNSNIDTIIKGLPCRNLELRNKFKIQYNGYPRSFKAITTSRYENLYYINQNWKNKDSRIKRNFNDTLNCFVADTFVIIQSEYVYTAYLSVHGDVNYSYDASNSYGNSGGEYKNINNSNVLNKTIMFGSIGYLTINLNYINDFLSINEYRYKKESGSNSYETSSYKILK